MFKAKDIMTNNVATASRDTDIYQAVKTMVDKNITGLPVLNDDGSLAGVITEKDALKLLYDIENDNHRNVEDYMSKGIVSFNDNDSLIDITDCLIKNNFRRVPIMSKGKLAGIISRKDIIAYILKLRHKD
ncbi:MAG: CBS domain-containing protein [Planctomycetota bacterium]|jgi:CBS domain-containing protein